MPPSELLNRVAPVSGCDHMIVTSLAVQIDGPFNFAATINSFLTHEFASVMRFDVRFRPSSVLVRASV